MIMGSCPYCDGQIEVLNKEVQGKKVKLFACSNNPKMQISEDGEFFEKIINDPDNICEFKIWQNSLARYGKWLTYNDVRTLLEEQELEVNFISKKYSKKIEYTKTIILDKEYGVSVLWE